MSGPTGKPRDKRVRLSLECSLGAKQAIESHGEELGEWSIISAIRHSVARSKWLFDLEARGTLLLRRDIDGEIEEPTRDRVKP